jgi:hypothetical protein
MRVRPFSVFLILAAVLGIGNQAYTDATADEDNLGIITQPTVVHFDAMASVLTGNWEGQVTNGTFDAPTEWRPVRVEYRLTANGTALIEDYLFNEGPKVGMTTVYHKDNNDLRLTHYCGAANHPSMIARDFDPETRSLKFDFVNITNHKSPESYHSRQLILTIVDNDNIEITYHGLKNAKVNSQAYRLTRAGASSITE